MIKIKRLRGRLKLWNLEVFRNIFTKIREANDLLDDIQRRTASDGDSEDLFNQELNQISKLNGLLAKRHALLFKKNRLLWLKDGDRNSAFFHRLHSTQCSRASITTVQVDENFYNLDSNIGNQVASYYQCLFSKDDALSQDYSILQNISWPTISEEQNDLLTSIPTDEEIK